MINFVLNIAIISLLNYKIKEYVIISYFIMLGNLVLIIFIIENVHFMAIINILKINKYKKINWNAIDLPVAISMIKIFFKHPDVWTKWPL